MISRQNQQQDRGGLPRPANGRMEVTPLTTGTEFNSKTQNWNNGLIEKTKNNKSNNFNECVLSRAIVFNYCTNTVSALYSHSYVSPNIMYVLILETGGS